MTRVDLDTALPQLPALTPGGQRYQRALILVALHGMPISVIEVEVTPGVATSPPLLAALMWRRIRTSVNTHLQEDGLPELAALDDSKGISHTGNGTGPKCRTFPTSGLSSHDVSVVIPTIGRSAVLETLLRTLLAGMEKPREILIALNDPADRSVASLVRNNFAGEPVHVVDVPTRGAAHARNTGAGRAQGRVLAFLDDDVEIDRHWMAGVLRGFGRAEEVSCVTGLILPASLEDRAQLHLQRFGGFDKGAVPTLFDNDEHVVPHPLYPFLPGIFGSGANLAVRKETFEALGGFDERLGPGTATRGGEDIDLLMRTVLTGRVIAYEPQALVHHHHRAADRELRRTVFGYGAGLGAVLVKQAVQRDLRWELVRRLPQGIRYLLSPSSAKNVRTRNSHYPTSLRVAELAGIASAPVVYMRSRPVRSPER